MPQRESDKTGIPESEMELLIALWAVQEAVRRLDATVGRFARVVARQRRPAPVDEPMSGVPYCPGLTAFNTLRGLAPDCETDHMVQPAESVDSSAMIPPAAIEKADRGGE